MPDKRLPSPKPPRQLPVVVIALIDIALIGIALVIFALFDHVIPSQGVAVVDRTYAPVVTAAPTSPAPDQSVADSGDQAAVVTAVPVSTATPAPDPASMGDFSAKFADKFTSGEVIQTENSYQSANVNVTVTRYDTVLADNSPAVYYIQDIYIRTIDCLRSAFANDRYGRAITEGVLSMSQRANAIAAINGDYYAVGTAGIVIRNGVLYRDTFEADEEVLVIYRDGRMKVYHNPASQTLNLEEAMQNGAWQAFSFGPAYFDEEGGFQVTIKKGLYHDPRTVIGMVEPGHYIFMVADGRQDGYSEGMTYEECAGVMRSLGCTVAYNLDGGQTSQMTFMGQMTNKPTGGGRPTSEIIYIADWNE